MVVEARGPRVQWMDYRSSVEALVVTRMGSVGVGSSGSGCGERSGMPPRDPTRGKDAVAFEETPLEADGVG